MRRYFDPWVDLRGPAGYAPLPRSRWERPVERARPVERNLAPVHEAPPPPTPRPAEPSATEPQAAPPTDATDKAQVRRALDELESAKRRVQREAQRVQEQTRAGVLDAMLPILDNLDRSIGAGQGTSDPALLEGVKLVRAQFEEALGRYGLERIDSVGRRFDPGVHDAIAVVEVDDPSLDGTVVDEWQRGYRLGERIVRAPKVRVGRLAAPA